MTTFAIFDYETNCPYDEQELSLTAFCGSCALKNSATLFWNVNSPLTYNQVNILFDDRKFYITYCYLFFKLCLAYKAVSPIVQIGLTVFLDGDLTTTTSVYISVTTIGDNQWHYQCFDMYQELLTSWSTTSSFYPNYRITLIGVIKSYKNMISDIIEFF